MDTYGRSFSPDLFIVQLHIAGGVNDRFRTLVRSQSVAHGFFIGNGPDEYSCVVIGGLVRLESAENKGKIGRLVHGRNGAEDYSTNTPTSGLPQPARRCDTCPRSVLRAL